MTTTYDSIATTTLSAATRNITFNSIPATFTDLRVVWVGRNATTADFVEVTFNNNTSGYSWTHLSTNGTGVSSGRITSNTKWVPNFPASGSASIPFMFTVDIFSYTGSHNKTGLMTCSADLNGSGLVIRSVGLWQNSSAITSIKLEGQTDDFAAGTTATLYGIKSE